MQRSDWQPPLVEGAWPAAQLSYTDHLKRESRQRRVDEHHLYHLNDLAPHPREQPDFGAYDEHEIQLPAKRRVEGQPPPLFHPLPSVVFSSCDWSGLPLVLLPVVS